MARFLDKQLTRAEQKPLGRTERYMSFDAKGAFHSGTRRLSAKKAPPLVTQEEFPVGRSRGVHKP